VIEDAKGKREQEELGDAMKALENRTTDSKVEMDILDALDEIRSLNARQSKMDPLEVLIAKQLEEEAEEQRLNEEDEELVKAAFGGIVKRIDDTEDESEAKGANHILLAKLGEEPIFTSKRVKLEPLPYVAHTPKNVPSTRVKIHVKSVEKEESIGECKPKEPTGLLSLLGSYAGESESNSD